MFFKTFMRNAELQVNKIKIMVGAGFEFYSLTTNIAKDTGVNMNPIWNLE